MKDHRNDALVTLRAAYPEWTFELDGQAISARLAPSRHLLLWTGIVTWKAKVVSWPGGPALADRIGGYVASSPDEVRCMAALLGAIAAVDGAATPDAPEVAEEPAGDEGDALRFCLVCATSTLETELHELGDAHLCQWCLADRARDLSAEVASLEVAQRILGEPADAPDDGLAHDDWEVPPPALDLVNELRVANETNARQLAALRNALIVERELRAELERVRKERDELLAPICAPSVPEPPPRAGGALVTPMVLAWIASQRANVGQERVDQALRLVLERDAFGRGKYGQGLALEDGRNTFEDLRQELGDALQYGLKLRIEGVDEAQLEEGRWLVHLLWLLLCADKVEVGP